jgi:hypothetical protein
VLNTNQQEGETLMRKMALSGIALLCFLLIFAVGKTSAQSSVQSLESIKSQEELDKVIKSLDAALFDSYNRCELDKFSTFFTDDVEFYHDQGGITLGKEKLTESIKNNICGGDVRRELVAGTFQAHHMKGYGAVEIGVHRFYHPKSNTPTGEGRFIHLWQYKNGAWKITRAISYDHHIAAR